MSSSPSISPAVHAVFLQAAQVLKPPPKLTVSQWAERHRVLSTESAAEAGQYRVARAPYQRAMMDAVNIPGVEEIVFFTGAQLGKSTVTENIAGYFMSEDPCPIIWMWPTEQVAKDWSADSFSPFLRDNQVLARLVQEGVRTSANRALFKAFPGGMVSIIGANAPAGLRRRKARVVIADEVDGYPLSAGGEGDPIELVKQRSVTFWNKLVIKASTCTEEGLSRISAAYDYTNQQKYWVPCPHCGEEQVLRWSRVSCPPSEEPTVDNTVYACVGCGAAIDELDKLLLLARGRWRADRPEVVSRQGFWLSSLYSPFETWAQLMVKWRNAQAHRENPELLKAFVTLSLAKPYRDNAERLDRHELAKRCEHLPRWPRGGLQLPDGVTVITCGCDVQKDRIEVELVGWGKGEESWSLDWRSLEGETDKLVSDDPKKPTAWELLDVYLLQRFRHVRGPEMEIASAFIDSGFHASEVYKFCKTRVERRVFPSKGMGNFGHPPLGKATHSNQQRVRLYPVGVSQIKRLIYSRLRIEQPGPGYSHFFKEHNTEDYFFQLTCEELKRKNQHGFPVQFWWKPEGARNEALDCRVYAYASFLSLAQNVVRMLEVLREQLLEEAKALKEKQDPNQLSLIDDDGPADPFPAPGESNAASLAGVAETAVRLVAARLLRQALRKLPPEPDPAGPQAPEPPRVRTRSNWATTW